LAAHTPLRKIGGCHIGLGKGGCGGELGSDGGCGGVVMMVEMVAVVSCGGVVMMVEMVAVVMAVEMEAVATVEVAL
jgi:hypothetical protein